MDTQFNESNMLCVLSVAQIKDLARNAVEEILAEWKKEKEDGDLLVNTKQACAMLGKSRETLWDWNRRGYLKVIKVGASNMYRKSDIDDILNSKGLK